MIKVKKGFVFFDIETSVTAEKAFLGEGAITQIAAIAVDSDFVELNRFERKIIFDYNSGNTEILEKTHFKKEIWEKEGAPPLKVAKEFTNFCKQYAFLTQEKSFVNYQFCVMGGHNISTFDLPVLFNWYKRLSQFFKIDLTLPAQYQPCIDTLSMINLYELRHNKWFISHKLPDLCGTFNIKLDNWHDALSDVQATVQLAKVLIKEI